MSKETQSTPKGVSPESRVVLSYPDKPLGKQVRCLNDTQSAFDVVREEFFGQKD